MKCLLKYSDGLYLSLLICFAVDVANAGISSASSLSEIDKTNRREICSLLYESERGGKATFSKLCEPIAHSAYLEFVCPIVNFQRTSNEVKFLNELPMQKEKIHYLWDIDRLILSDINKCDEGDMCKKVKMITSSTPPDILVNQLYVLMLKGSKNAAWYYLFLLQNAEGEFGEKLEEHVYQLISLHPKVFIQLWPDIKPSQHNLVLSTTNIKRDLKIVRGKYIELCAEKTKTTCKEILDYLDNIEVSGN